MNRSVREGKSVKRFERSNGPDIALYKNYIFYDSSLYLFVLVLFLEAVVLSQVHVAWDIFYQHIVHVYRGVVYNHHICLCDVHLKTYSSTFIG